MEQSNKRRALGRGLGALIPGAPRERVEPTPPAAPEPVPTEVRLAEIAPNPWQPRRRFRDESIEELASSIRERGVVQPLIVRRAGTGFELIAGERRLRAATRVGLEKVPVAIRDASDAEMLEVALIENIQREDLNPIEEALAYKRMAEELGLKQEVIATRVGKERSTVANSLRLLQLPPEVQEAVELGKLTAGHARAIAMAGSVEAMIRLARRALEQKLNVRQTERMAKAERPAKKQPSIEVRDLEERLTRALGTRVRIAPHSAVAGSISIDYFSLDQFDQLLRRLGL